MNTKARTWILTMVALGAIFVPGCKGESADGVDFGNNTSDCKAGIKENLRRNMMGEEETEMVKACDALSDEESCQLLGEALAELHEEGYKGWEGWQSDCYNPEE